MLSFFVLHKAFILEKENLEDAKTLALIEGSNDSHFLNIDYYKQDQQKPVHHLEASRLLIHSNSEILHFVKPQGQAYPEDGRVVHYEGDRGKLLQKDKKIFLYGHALMEDAESEVLSNNASYDITKDFFEAEGNVRSKNYSLKTKDKINVLSDLAFSWPKQKIAHYTGNVRGTIKRARPFEPGIYFESRQLDAFLNKSYIQLLDNVYIKKGEMKAYALRGEIFLENYNKKLKYYALYDDVKVIEKVYLNKTEDKNQGSETEAGTLQEITGPVDDTKPVKAVSPAAGSSPVKTVIPVKPAIQEAPFVERRSFSEKLEGHVREGKIILTGNPKVIQENDILKGNIITLFENEQVIEVDDSNSSFIIKE